MLASTAEDVDVFEVHDAFTIGEIVTIEALGLAPLGEGAELTASGHTTIGGPQPVNPSGGLLSRGHPLGATGLAQVAEIVWQLRGTAGARQVDGATARRRRDDGRRHRRHRRQRVRRRRAGGRAMTGRGDRPRRRHAHARARHGSVPILCRVAHERSRALERSLPGLVHPRGGATCSRRCAIRASPPTASSRCSTRSSPTSSARAAQTDVRHPPVLDGVQRPPRPHPPARLVNRAFTPKAIAALRPRIEEVVAEQIEVIRGRGTRRSDPRLRLPDSRLRDRRDDGRPCRRRDLFKSWSDDDHGPRLRRRRRAGASRAGAAEPARPRCLPPRPARPLPSPTRPRTCSPT